MATELLEEYASDQSRILVAIRFFFSSRRFIYERADTYIHDWSLAYSFNWSFKFVLTISGPLRHILSFTSDWVPTNLKTDYSVPRIDIMDFISPYCLAKVVDQTYLSASK